MNERQNTEKTGFKAKWDNYWYYYKMHTWAAIFVVFVMIVTITQCVQTVKPDVTIDLVTSVAVADSNISLGGVFDDVITYANSDGKKQLNIATLYLPEELKSEQDIAMQQKMMIELAAGEVSMFIFDKMNIDRYITQDAYSPLSDFIDITPYEDIEGKLIKRDGVAYGISLKGSQKLSELGFLVDDLYAVFRFVPRDAQKDEAKLAEYKNAAAILQELLK